MRQLLRAFAVSLTALGATDAVASRPETGRPGDTLTISTASGWVAHHLQWRHSSPGAEWAELRLGDSGPAWPTRLVIVRLDPARIRLSLVAAFTRDERWNVGHADRDVTVALDAGQFRRSLPYGWVVSGGHELLPPEYAPLAAAVVVDHSGVRIVAPDSIALERSRATALEAFQSYPILLHQGEIPLPLHQAGQGVDLEHRDTRLALGTLADGRVIIVLTRFDALGGKFGRVPLGLTTPEMATIMRELGCREALLLDGGISGQLMLRDRDGTPHSWAGLRSVPLGLVGRPVTSP